MSLLQIWNHWAILLCLGVMLPLGAQEILNPPLVARELPTKGFEVDRFSRNEVIRLWHEVYQPGEADFVTDKGTLFDLDNSLQLQAPRAQVIVDHIERRVNVLRAFAGVSTEVDFTDLPVPRPAAAPFQPSPGATREGGCRELVMWMARNKTLTHEPEKGVVSEDARSAALFSNLALGVHGVRAIDLYCFEPGTAEDPLFNKEVGHRRAVLYSRLKEAQTGDINGFVTRADGTREPRLANALHVFGDFEEPKEPQLIAWPNDGFVPQPLVSRFWSASYPGAIFTDAEVTVVGPEGPIPVVVHAATIDNLVPDEDLLPRDISDALTSLGGNRAFWDSTVSFELTAQQPTEENTRNQDRTYQVKIRGLRGDAPAELSYSVTVINPNRVEEEPGFMGVDRPPVDGAIYRLDPVEEASGYQVELATSIDTNWVEEGEPATRGRLRQFPFSAPDDVFRPNTLQEVEANPEVPGGLVFSEARQHRIRLTFPEAGAAWGGFTDRQGFQLGGRLLPQAGARLFFDYYQGFLATGNRCAVQVSRDHWRTWDTLWTLNGASTRLVEPAVDVEQASVSLVDYVGEVVEVRFVLENPNNGTYFLPSQSPWVGVILDRLRFEHVLEQREIQRFELGATALQVGLRPEDFVAGLQRGAVFTIRARALFGRRLFPWSDLQTLRVGGQVVVDSWEDYVRLNAPGLQFVGNDTDEDGVPNGLEYVFGTEALNQGSGAPQVEVVFEGGMPCLAVPINGEVPDDVEIWGEWSPDGISWQRIENEPVQSGGMLKVLGPARESNTEPLFLRWRMCLK